jgi:hypothetical protein
MAPTMSARRLLAAAGAGCVAIALAGQLPAQAAPGPGTWTRVTTPREGTTILRNVDHAKSLTIAGKTSTDVTAVDVLCLGDPSDPPAAAAIDVPIVNGAFTVTVPVPATADNAPICRLRAVPTGVDPSTAYLGSYAGPVVHLDTLQRVTSGGKLVDYELNVGSGTGMSGVSGVGSCAATYTATVFPDLSQGFGSAGCVAGLPTVDAAKTHSAIRVDGHETYTPDGEAFRGLSPGSMSLSTHVLKTGAVSWVETDSLERCAGDVYPASSGSCPDPVSTGVQLTHQGVARANGHQLAWRDTFRSTDGKRHHLRLSFYNQISGMATGGVGFEFPGDSHLHASSPGNTVTGLGKHAASMLARNDRFTVEGDPRGSTLAVSWSRKPSRVHYDPTDDHSFWMDYVLTVPRKGTVSLGFATSESLRTTQARTLGARAVHAMMSAPRVTSPAKGALVKGQTTTVKGVVRAGANGLPTSVSVNGHAATLKPSKSGAKAAFSVTFKESLGKHTLKVVATDAGGNRRSTSLTVRNT